MADRRELPDVDEVDPLQPDTVTALPQLGPDAFLVIDTKPERPRGNVGFPADVTGGIALPATAYWRHGDATFSASGTRAGATVSESTRITTRLAELINRRPTERDDR